MGPHDRRYDHQMPDPEDIKKILDAVGDRVPELLKKLSSVLYDLEQAKKFGKAAGTYFQELKSMGMSPEQAFELTRQYMSSLNVGQVFSHVGKDHKFHHNHGHGYEYEYEEEND